MAKVLAKSIVVVFVCMLLSIATGNSKTRRPSSPAAAAEKVELQERATVAVEAYLLQVPTETLQKAGVAIIPTSSKESVTISKLLSTLNASKNKATLIDSAIVVCRDNEEGRNRTTNRFYLKQTYSSHGKEQHKIEAFDNGSSCDVKVNVAEDDLLRIQLSFDYSGIVADRPSGEDCPPDTVNFSVTRTFNIKAGKPVIIARGQSGDNSLFLIVRAEILK